MPPTLRDKQRSQLADLSGGATPLPYVWTMMRAGIRAVPQLRYLLGFGAVVALVAIVGSLWRQDLRVALFGSLVVLLMMTLVLVFARGAAATHNSHILYGPAIALTWFAVVAMIASTSALFGSVFFQWPIDLRCWLDTARCTPLRTPEEEQVIALQTSIMDLRQYLLSVETYPEARAKLAPARDLADVLSGFPDARLNPTRRYNKREYAAAGYLMATVAEENNSTKAADNARRSIRSADDALQLLATAKERYHVDPDAQLLVDWVREDSGEDRVKYFRTEAFCLLAKVAPEEQQAKQHARDGWNDISEAFKQKFPAEKTRELKGCVP